MGMNKIQNNLFTTKKLKLKANNIINKTNKFNNDKFIFNLIINYLIYFNLKIENILFDKKNHLGNPLNISKKYLNDLEVFILSLDKIKKFSSKIIIKALCSLESSKFSNFSNLIYLDATS